MTTAEVKKIALIIFHVIAVMLLFTSVSLVLDKIFTQSSIVSVSDASFKITSVFILAIITIVIAAVSGFILIKKWIQEMRLEYYLKSILFTNAILIIGLALLLLV